MHCQYCPITLDDSANNPFSSFEEYWINHCQAKIVQSERLETRKGSQHRYCTSNYNVALSTPKYTYHRQIIVCTLAVS